MKRAIAEEIVDDWHQSSVPKTILRNKRFTLPKVNKTIAITGPRRAGKTFFMFNIINDHLSVPLSDTLYVNFEDHRIVAPTVETLDILINTYFERYPLKASKTVYLFLDEVQNVPNWERFVRSGMDSKNIRFFVSGSSSKLLSKEIATSLRGRSITSCILPFSFKEVLMVHDIKISSSAKGRSRILSELTTYLEFGGFPEIVLEDDDFVIKEILKQYVDVMLFRDVVDRYRITNVAVLKLLMGQMMASCANLFSVNKFHNFLSSQGFRIDKNSLYEFVDHLVDAYGFIIVRKINRSYRSIEQGLPKIYSIDMGYMMEYGLTLRDNMGRYIENCVAVELFRRLQDNPGTALHFWRDVAGREVDFVLMKGGKPKSLIQACYDIDAAETLEREVVGLLKGSADLRCDDMIILNWNREDVIEHDGKKIELVPLWKWLLEG